jgi:hypothetical protein
VIARQRHQGVQFVPRYPSAPERRPAQSWSNTMASAVSPGGTSIAKGVDRVEHCPMGVPEWNAMRLRKKWKLIALVH